MNINFIEIDVNYLELNKEKILGLSFENLNLNQLKKVEKNGVLKRIAYRIEKGNKLIGIMNSWENEFHNKAQYININLKDSYYGKGIEQLALEELKKVFTSKKYFQTLVASNQKEKIKELTKLNFKLVRKTLECQIKLDKVDGTSSSITNSQVKSIKDLKRGSLEWQESLNLITDCYNYTHKINPPSIKFEESIEELVMEDLILDGSFILKRDNEIIAFALLHHFDNESLDLGWRGAMELNNESEIIKVLTQLQIKYAKNHNFNYLNCEIDSTDKWARVLEENYEFELGNEDFLTYQKIKNIN